jgi:hypothetical protein
MKSVFINKISTKSVTFFGIGADRGLFCFMTVVVWATFGLETTGRGETFLVVLSAFDDVSPFGTEGETLGFCGGFLTPVLILVDDAVFGLLVRIVCCCCGS